MSRKKSSGHHGSKHQEELWLISYADMMTLLFGFFVILYSFSKVDEKKLSDFGKAVSQTMSGDEEQESKIQAGLMNEARQLRALQFLVASLKLGDSVDEAVRKIERTAARAEVEDVMENVVKKELKVDDSKDKGKVIADIQSSKKGSDLTVDLVLPSLTMFTAGSATVTPEGLEGLKKIAATLVKLNGLTEVQVVGHTDSIPPTGQFTDNFMLSAARASTVARELTRFGVARKYLRASGMADMSPLFPERDGAGKPIPENMAKNRRVHIVVKRLSDGQ